MLTDGRIWRVDSEIFFRGHHFGGQNGGIELAGRMWEPENIADLQGIMGHEAAHVLGYLHEEDDLTAVINADNVQTDCGS